jgi:hypothetical protein
MPRYINMLLISFSETRNQVFYLQCSVVPTGLSSEEGLLTTMLNYHCKKFYHTRPESNETLYINSTVKHFTIVNYTNECFITVRHFMAFAMKSGVYSSKALREGFLPQCETTQ